MTGYGQAASHLGCPDVGLLTSRRCGARRRDRRGLRHPGHRGRRHRLWQAVNVRRTLREYEKAGVAVIQLEDQVMHEKMRAYDRRQVITKDEMVGKIKAAVDTRTDPDMMIMARTDARTVLWHRRGD